jgi:hypothetical protein
LRRPYALVSASHGGGLCGRDRNLEVADARQVSRVWRPAAAPADFPNDVDGESPPSPAPPVGGMGLDTPILSDRSHSASLSAYRCGRGALQSRRDRFTRRKS